MNASGRANIAEVGDQSNPFPGIVPGITPKGKGNRSFTATSTPNSKDFSGRDTFISVKNISDVGRTMRIDIALGPQTSGPDRASKL